MIETKKESIDTIYKDGELVSIVKRDDKTKKHLVYMVDSATSDDIVELINLNNK